MRTWYAITRAIPARVVIWTHPFFTHWRWVALPPAWSIVGALLPNWSVSLYVNLSMLVALVVGFSWLSMWMPWDDIDRVFRYLTYPRAQRKALRRFDKAWPDFMMSAGLGHLSQGPDRLPVYPPLYGLEFDERGNLRARPGLMMGQTADDSAAKLEEIRVACGATNGRVVTDATRNSLEYVFTFPDPLSEPFEQLLPGEDEVPVDYSPIGLTEDGERWDLPLSVSTLTAGATGAGKASVMWSVIIGQGSNIASGLVQLQGIDLKGGMELSPGLPMFTRYATAAPEAVVLLEEAAQQCQARAHRMAGRVRSHEASAEEPLVLIVIDELANLVVYLPDRDLMRRAEAAMAVILTQGRAVGYYLFGFLQDPRKEVFKIRQLFTQSVALSLKEQEEAAMMLSHQAVRDGAHCEHIPMGMPGTGYVLDEIGRVTRVRAGYCSDELIREAAERWPTPVQIPVVVPEITAAPTRSRRTRSEAA